MTRRERLSILPSMRAALSDVWIPKYWAAVQKELKAHAREAAEAVKAGADIARDRVRWEGELVTAQQPYAVQMAVEGYNLGEVEFGKTAMLDELLAKVGPDIALAFDSEELIARKMEPAVRAWLESRTTSIVDTELTRMSYVMDRARADNKTVGEIARTLQDALLVESRAKAMQIARSATIWNYNEGAQQFYVDSGVGAKEWLTTSDDVLCEFCEAMDGVQVEMQNEFLSGGISVEGNAGGTMDVGDYGIEHPPLHPSCRCALLPVI